MSPEIIAAIIGGIAVIVAAFIQRNGSKEQRLQTASVERQPTSFLPRFVRGGLVGLIVGAVVFFVSFAVAGPPPDFAFGILLFLGGGGAIGGILTALRILVFG